MFAFDSGKWYWWLYVAEMKEEGRLVRWIRPVQIHGHDLYHQFQIPRPAETTVPG
jgi:hypothetical protein